MSRRRIGAEGGGSAGRSKEDRGDKGSGKRGGKGEHKGIGEEEDSEAEGKGRKDRRQRDKGKEIMEDKGDKRNNR